MNLAKTNVYTVREIIEFISYWKKTIILFFLIGSLIGVALAFIVQRQYKSIARVIPPKESNVLNGLSGISSLVKSLPSGLGNLAKTGASEELNYFAILKSRTVMEELINKFNLKKVYEVSDSSMEKTIKILQTNIEIDWTEENLLEIRVWDADPKRAADVANYYVALLNQRSYELYTTEARYNRQFIEQRVEKNKLDLWNAEQAFKKYQEKNKTFIPVDIESASSSGFGELVALKTKKEIEVSILRETVGEQHPQFKQARIELEILDKKMMGLPDLAVESLRLMREVMIQQKIMEILIPLYEQAKVNEHKDIPAAYILDNAIPGERPDRPKRILIVGISSFLGLLMAGIVISYKLYNS